MSSERRSPRKTKPLSRSLAPDRSEDGVDLTLIRWMLSLTPAQRLQVLQRNIRSLMRMRAWKDGEQSAWPPWDASAR